MFNNDKCTLYNLSFIMTLSINSGNKKRKLTVNFGEINGIMKLNNLAFNFLFNSEAEMAKWGREMRRATDEIIFHPHGYLPDVHECTPALGH